MNQACYKHPTILAAATCADCNAPICAACIRQLRDEPYCVADYAIARHDPIIWELPEIMPAYHSSPIKGVEVVQYLPCIVQPERLIHYAAAAPNIPTLPQPQPRRPFRYIVFSATFRLTVSIVVVCLGLVNYLFFTELTRILPTHGPGRSSLGFQLVQYQLYFLMGIAALLVVVSVISLLARAWNHYPNTSLPVRVQRDSHSRALRVSGVTLLMSIVGLVILIIGQLTFLTWHWLPCCG